MKVDIPGLEAFLSIADLGSFRRGAAHLNLSQTAVSHRLRKLEESLGVKLFTRTTRQIGLTQAGAELLPSARALLKDFEHQLDQISRRHRDEQSILTLACMPTIAVHVLPDVFAGFMQQNPSAKVRIFDRSATEIGETVASGEAEFGVAILAANRWGLATEPLLTDEYLLVCPADHVLAGRESVTWSDLEKFPLIRCTERTANRIIVDEALGVRAERMNWTYEVQHTMTAFMLVQGGIGLAIAPRLAIVNLQSTGLTAIPLARPRLTRTVGLLSRKSDPPSALAQSFQRILRSKFPKAGACLENQAG
ncbi:MAG: DNA-binding transcriptional regulator, LysR family [Hyphomicrobiales bacterium]|nr:DNA-binding transcriptional regulator, LysR family [Hyphomicrobiales bacterium]